MAGSKAEVKKLLHDSATIAKKIVIYSKTDPTGDKFLKYLQYVSLLKRHGSTSRSRSPWVELRTYGALEAVMTALKTIFVSGTVQELEQKNVRKQKQPGGIDRGKARHICNVALSVLGDAFALDYSARSEAVSSGYISSLQQFIANFTQDSDVAFKKANAEILSRAVKCMANLSNDSHCREAILRTGVGISILRILDLAHETVLTDPTFADDKRVKSLICSCVRAIRILASDSKFMSNGREHLMKFGGLVTIINVLTWDAKVSSEEDLVLDVIRALTFLSLRIRGAPLEVVDKLIDNPEVCKIRTLVRILEASHPDGKIFLPVIKCLINFCTNKEISDCFGELRIFPIVLEKLENLDENHFQDLIKLLIALTKYSSFNQNRLITSSLIGSTMKILKSSRFKEYHEWLLTVYEKLYEVSLSKLIQYGLVNHLCDILSQELEYCDYESLRNKISSLESNTCSIHKVCTFAPIYRCSSPSYQQIQEEMKTKIQIGDVCDNYQVKKGEDSLSPFSSPAHSWTSGISSPRLSDSTHFSYSSISEEEDEGCYSPKYQVGSRHSSLSDDEADPNEVLNGACDDSDEQEPAIKRQKMNFDHNEISDSRCHKSLEILKTSVKRIVGVLNILYNCTHSKPFPESMFQITPVLLGIILRGKVSLMPQRLEYQKVETDDEYRDLSRRTFEVSYKIISKICSTIQTFPTLIVSGMVPVLCRLQEPINVEGNDELIAIVQDYCSNLLTAAAGVDNNTAGWREGFIMRSLLVNDSNSDMTQLILNIPLLYQRHAPVLRKFEGDAKSWTKILDMLLNSDDLPFYRFEDCTLALYSICFALGMKWTDRNADQLPILFQPPSRLLNDVVTISKVGATSLEVSVPHNENRVKLVLDDGTVFSVKKDLLVDASPVFSAMFNGGFVEADEQSVNLPSVSKNAVTMLLEQIYMMTLSETGSDTGNNSSSIQQYDLTAILEVFSLADRFLLGEVYERALNSMMVQYLCPYSVPLIYSESVKLTSLQKSGNSEQMLGDMGLNYSILKYILTAGNIRMSERCSAMRKIFEMVVPSHVVQDLRTLIKTHMYKN